MKKNSLIRKASSIVGRSFLESRRSFLESRRSFRMGSIAPGRFGSIQDPTEHRERFQSGSMPALHSYLRTRLNSSYQSISPVRMTSLLVTEPEMHKKPRSKTKMKENLKAVREDMQMEDHMLDLDDLEVKLGTCLKTGLTDYQAAELLMRDGLNELTPIKSSSSQAQFGRHFCSGFMVLMWIAASLCFVAYLIEVIDKPKPQNDYLYIGIVLVSVILIIGLFTFCQENRSSKIMDSFTHMLPQKSRVLREGELIEVRSEELVVGDIVEIKAGDCIPADIRIISVKGLKVDHSSLTGESELLERTCECTDEVLLDSKNMAFFATTAVEGSCRGVVIATGDNTVMGRIATLTSGLEVMETPIAKEINLFVQVVTLIALVLGIIFFALCLVFGYSWIESVIFLICVLVANVPEALLCTLTVCLTKTAKRMAKKNCVAKSLESIETLGSISTICTDKTGTLTQNRMSASHMWFDMTLWKVDLTPEQKHALYTRDDLSWLALARAAVLCNKAVFVNDFDEESVLKRECIGNPSEIGLLRFVELAIGNVSDSRFWNETVAEIPFNSRNKFQLSIHKSEDPLDQRFLVLMKGAPEIILRQCSTYLLEGIQVAIDKNFVRAYELAVARLGKLGERVFGFCQVYLPETVYHSKFQFNVENPNFQTCNLCCLGLISLIDPPRPQVPDAIAKCRVAGIKVIMVTGDHPQTAEAIARAVGIISPSSRTVDDIAEDMGLPVEIVNPRDASAAIIRGSDMIKMKQYDLDEIIQQYTEIIFARTTPLQKLFIIESLQRQGQIVAVTGDGVNDSPALRKADIGISMGIAGSDVSKQAADMILLDDNFASIVTGIEEGRMIFDNMKKAIAYVLAANIPEIVPFFCFIIFSTPLPLGVITILVIDISTNLFPAISFAHEAPESDIMRRQPRNPITDRLVSRRLIVMAYCKIGMIHTAGAFFSWATVMHMHGFFLRDLYQVRENWDSPAVNDLQDSYGQQWTYYQRKEVEYSAQTAFFVSIVITQWASLIMCRCRRGSIFQHGMRNHYINASILFGTVLAILIVYIPTDMVLRTKPLSFVYWLTPIPFALLIVIYDESRKFILRRNPGGFVENQFYY